jgi:hypothetical protein
MRKKTRAVNLLYKNACVCEGWGDALVLRHRLRHWVRVVLRCCAVALAPHDGAHAMLGKPRLEVSGVPSVPTPLTPRDPPPKLLHSAAAPRSLFVGTIALLCRSSRTYASRTLRCGAQVQLTHRASGQRATTRPTRSSCAPWVAACGRASSAQPGRHVAPACLGGDDRGVAVRAPDVNLRRSRLGGVWGIAWKASAPCESRRQSMHST